MSTYQPYGGYNQQDYNGGDYNSGGFDTHQASSQQNRSQQKTSLTPVTIKEIIDSKTEVQDGDFVIHGIELSYVSFVGVIRNVTDQTSNLLIQIEDGTGSIEIRKWLDDNAPPDSNASLVANKYFHVTGSVKEFSGKKNIQNATFREITDFNEVIYHQLSAIDVYFQAKNLTGGHQQQPLHQQNQDGLFVSNPDSNEQSASVSDRIFEFISENTPSMPEGVPVKLIAQSLNLLVDDVTLHCGKLTEDAKIYAGYDENGFLAV